MQHRRESNTKQCLQYYSNIEQFILEQNWQKISLLTIIGTGKASVRTPISAHTDPTSLPYTPVGVKSPYLKFHSKRENSANVMFSSDCTIIETNKRRIVSTCHKSRLQPTQLNSFLWKLRLASIIGDAALNDASFKYSTLLASLKGIFQTEGTTLMNIYSLVSRYEPPNRYFHTYWVQLFVWGGWRNAG